MVGPEDKGSDWEIAVIEDKAKVVMAIIMGNFYAFWGNLEEILNSCIIESICILVM